MVISKGQPWGDDVDRPDAVPTAASDADLARLVGRGGAGEYSVTSGDLHAALGTPPSRTPIARRLPMDLLHVATDRGEWPAVAHVIARRRWWRGRIVAALNVGKVGRWDAVPAAHPNDGRFESLEVDASMPWRDRLAARRRLPVGAHIPHPSIRVRHVERAAWTFDAPVRCLIDGVDRGTITRLEVSIEPDAFALIV